MRRASVTAAPPRVRDSHRLARRANGARQMFADALGA